MNMQPLIAVLAASLNSCIRNLLLKWSRASLPSTGLANKFLSIGFIGGAICKGSRLHGGVRPLSGFGRSGFAMLAVTSSYIFGEPFHLRKWIRLDLVFAGIIFLARGDKNGIR
ncbi:QacE family quaternary ammonium compound efflux SMR transporter [Bradyrhizobium sp. 141]|uniref:QacE family quaternary ammonium compound efflux SMR transporter n=1 Tax=Bradyrhizobium sp. 141 TaxID=2782617 RepID=UPI001FF93278|nr:QacE family quaternary ammonium compound efflux SMR transporter [Bradyrhizobium sp. 141]